MGASLGAAINAVVLRAIGPSLSRGGVSNPLSDPMLELSAMSRPLLMARRGLASKSNLFVLLYPPPIIALIREGHGMRARV